MQLSKIAAGTIAYLFITFPLAFVWHLVLFKSTYEELGYFSREEPIIAFGFGAILLQGILLSVLYPLICQNASLHKGALKFLVLLGGYHWTMHVLAAAAKQNIAPLEIWFALETTYLLIQFVLGGYMFAFIYRKQSRLVKVS